MEIAYEDRSSVDSNEDKIIRDISINKSPVSGISPDDKSVATLTKTDGKEKCLMNLLETNNCY